MDHSPSTPPQDQSVVEVTPVEEVETSAGRGPALMIVGFVAVLLVLGGSGFVINRWLNNTDQTAASAMPAGVDFYIGIDALRLVSDDTASMVETFGAMARSVDPTVEPVASDWMHDLDQELLDTYGFDFSNDIQPWVGRSIGIGFYVDDEMLSGSVDPFSASGEDLSGMMAVTVRDVGAADDFVEKLVAETNAPKLVVGGERFFEIDDYLFGRLGRLFLVGDAETIRRSVALEEGGRLTDTAGFVRLTAALPEDRLLEVYTSLDELMIDDFMGAGVGASSQSSPFGAPGEVAFSVSVRADALAFDFATRTFGSELDDVYESMNDDRFVSALPDTVVGFVQTSSVADLWTAFTQTDNELGVDPAAMAADLESELGFNVVEDLILRLDGPTGMALLDAASGIIYETTGVPAGFLVAMGTSEPTVVSSSLDRLVASVEREAGLSVAPVADGVYSVGDGASEQAVSVGVVGDWLGIAGSTDVLQALASQPAAPLTSDADYQAAVTQLGGLNQTVVGYFAVPRLVDMFSEDTTLADALAPLRSVVIGSAYDGEVTTGSAVLVVDQTRRPSGPST